MEELIKKELFKNVESFLNELDLTMDYLDPQVIPSIKNYMIKIDTDKEEYKNFLEYTTQHLGSHESKISAILFSNKKVKSDFYNFLNGITLFSNILNFRVFENESKNTKKGLIKYLYSIYMSSVFLYQAHTNQTTESEQDADLLTNKLAEFVDKIQKEAETTLKEEDIKTPNINSKHKRRNAVSYGRPDPELLPGFGNGEMGNLMDSILGNNEILSIATDISQKMQAQQINPMSMLSTLMTGNIENSPLQGLVEEIQQKVEDKINSGEIDKTKLEDQAKNLMGSISSNSESLNSMPGMSNLINNMMKEMEK
jgi:tetrahydromethanopterin S-methyltransferase subunit B